MANSVGSDQEQSDRVYTVCPDLSGQNLRIINTVIYRHYIVKIEKNLPKGQLFKICLSLIPLVYSCLKNSPAS